MAYNLNYNPSRVAYSSIYNLLRMAYTSISNPLLISLLIRSLSVGMYLMVVRL
jgi:hypothetical protein